MHRSLTITMGVALALVLGPTAVAEEAPSDGTAAGVTATGPVAVDLHVGCQGASDAIPPACSLTGPEAGTSEDGTPGLDAYVASAEDGSGSSTTLSYTGAESPTERPVLTLETQILWQSAGDSSGSGAACLAGVEHSPDRLVGRDLECQATLVGFGQQAECQTRQGSLTVALDCGLASSMADLACSVDPGAGGAKNIVTCQLY